MSTTQLLLGLGLLAPLGLGALYRPAAASAPRPTVAPAALEYQVDATHTSALFKVKHLGASWFYGRFNGVSGTIQVDESDLSKSSVLLTIDAASVDSRNEKLDEHIKSPDFLDAKQFPEIVFESEKVAAGKDKDTLQVDGKLTLRGVTRPLSVTVEKVGTGEMRGTKVVGYHTRFTIDRTEFGVSYGADGSGLGKEVEVILSVEAHGK